MKRRLVLTAITSVLTGCASSVFEGTPLDYRGPHGSNVVVNAPLMPLKTMDVVFVFNTIKFGEAMAAQLPYLRTPEFAKDFASQFTKVAEHNGLQVKVSVLDQPPAFVATPTLTAEVIDIISWNDSVNRFKYNWQLKSQDGATLVTWQSVSPWERSWSPNRNARDYQRGIAHLALVALNTLSEQKMVKLANSPALTLSNGRQAFY
jgi:hypothetical protein